jgi:DinB family protein
MLGIAVSQPALPVEETKESFVEHYAAASAERLAQLASKPDEWFEAETGFFDVRRSRAWVLTRRFTHSAHHRGQLTVYLRMWGQALYSTYGPTADTGGLFQNQAQVVYRYASIDDLIERERRGGEWPPLPGPGEKSPTERP